ncbi:MAG: hypothetical protein WBZ40_01955 [Acidimicrobiia bacterium]
MRRGLLLVVVAVMLIPAGPALAADLGELLRESRDASYTAEQVISCSTPNGVQNAVVDIAQAGGELQVTSPVGPDVEVASGSGGWTLVRDGAVVSSASVVGTDSAAEPRYTLDDGQPTQVLGRPATSYRMVGDGVVRAELVFDSESGVLVRAVTYGDDGTVYCERRFIEFDPDKPALDVSETVADSNVPPAEVETTLPEQLAGFQRLDVYQDDEGFIFAYYSDGFFSFAVFQTPTRVALDDPSQVAYSGHSYNRIFSPGQATYSWEIAHGGMALVGDLPPDMHQAVLDGLPAPYDPGLLRRLWRSLFG